MMIPIHAPFRDGDDPNIKLPTETVKMLPPIIAAAIIQISMNRRVNGFIANSHGMRVPLSHGSRVAVTNVWNELLYEMRLRRRIESPLTIPVTGREPHEPVNEKRAVRTSAASDILRTHSAGSNGE
jgi:hypothetical protein